jgi:hypothetical protein
VHFSSICLLAIAMPLLQSSEPDGVKITTQSGAAGHVTLTTTYKLSDRERMEYRNSFGRKSGQQTFGPRLARIVRCDLGQSFELNLDTSEYTSAPYPPKPLTPEEMKVRGLDTGMPRQSAPPTIRVEMNTNDTGERKEIFGRTARHVITTTTQTPLAGSHANPQESVIDGWYIDFDPRLSCDPKSAQASHGYAYFGTGNRKQPMEKPEFVRVGEPETGFPVDSKMTSKSPSSLPYRTAPSFETRVTQFEKGPLDPALFEIPPGFRHVDRIERNPPESALAGKPTD